MAKTRSTEEERLYRRALRARRKAEQAAGAAQSVPAADRSEPRSKPGPHRAAVTRMLRSTGLAHVPEEAPLVELVKTLATAVDNGDASATNRYRIALADVRKVLAYTGRPKASADPAPAADADPTPAKTTGATINNLAAFKAAHGIE